MILAGGMADLADLYGDPDYRGRAFRRDLRAPSLHFECPTCNAPAGAPCVRQTVAGPVIRRLPHDGRGPSQGAHNAVSHRGRYKRRGAG